jgi:hypothetical protein
LSNRSLKNSRLEKEYTGESRYDNGAKQDHFQYGDPGISSNYNKPYDNNREPSHNQLRYYKDSRLDLPQEDNPSYPSEFSNEIRADDHYDTSITGSGELLYDDYYPQEDNDDDRFIRSDEQNLNDDRFRKSYASFITEYEPREELHTQAVVPPPRTVYPKGNGAPTGATWYSDESASLHHRQDQQQQPVSKETSI